MALSEFIRPEGILIEESTSKDVIIDRLIGTSVDAAPFLDIGKVKEKIYERESDVSTNIAPGIAVPHAIFEEMPFSVVSIAVCSKGIEWQTYSEEPVYLVILLLGSRMTHLSILSEIATVLRDEHIYRSILSATSRKEVYGIITQFDRLHQPPIPELNADLSKLIFSKASDIAKSIKGKLILHSDAIKDTNYIIGLLEDRDTVIITTEPERFSPDFASTHNIFEIPFRGAQRLAQLEFSLLFLLSSGILKAGQTAINVYGTPDSGLFDSIRIIHTDERFDFNSSIRLNGITGDFGRHVLTRVLQLAGELAREGREGKPVGALFVVGDYKNVEPHTRQLIINPFNKYDEQQRNIIDPSLEETVKEFAKIDGAFVIREDGVILSCGTYISSDPGEGKLKAGLGARHAAALSITTQTDAFAVAISESTRKISVFHAGKMIVEM